VLYSSENRYTAPDHSEKNHSNNKVQAVALTNKNTADRPLWVDYKDSDFSTARNRFGRRQSAGKNAGKKLSHSFSNIVSNVVSKQGQSRKSARASLGIGMSPRRTPTVGAVKLSANPPPRFKHLRKASIGLLAIFGGILVTSQSSGTIDETKPAMPALAALITPKLIAPTFFFNDRDNALGDRQQLLAGTAINEKPNSDDKLAMAAPINFAANTPYTAQSADVHAGITESTAQDPLLTSPFGNEDTIPRTTTVSPLANHPSIAAIRKQAEFPDGAVEETVTVASGDTLSKLLNDRGVKIEQMPKLLTDEVIKQHLSNLRIGQTFKVVRLADGDFHSLSARLGNDRRVTIRRSDNGFATASIDLPVEKERVVTSGTIEQSLYIAAEQADLKQSTIMELSDIFQWELDFARDIRKGDQFSLVYDRLYREGKYIGDGDILAAEFIRGGKRYQAVRYTDPEGSTGYFAPNGDSKRRTFLRHPVDVVRITSRFDPKRVHPVLHQIRAHKGVDYGSPTGTPIRATANGVVKFAGRKSAYGKTVILSHGTDIRTLYAHMSRISDKVKHGKRVKQGDVIGYVGATGRVTGAHLHYEFQKNGKHVDPLKVKLPAADPLRADLRDELRELSDDLLAQMQSVLPTEDEQVAKAPVQQ